MDASPNQRFIDPRTRTLIPTVSKLLEPTAKNEERKKLKKKQADQYNKDAKDIPCLGQGDVVRMKPIHAE